MKALVPSAVIILSLVIARSTGRGLASDENAPHIFNAIHSSMRQFGSSLNHNGMSVFIATVPEGTELYHGTGRPDRVNETEWLAFEPEHALIFARTRGPPGGHHPPEHSPSRLMRDSEEHESLPPPHSPPLPGRPRYIWDRPSRPEPDRPFEDAARQIPMLSNNQPAIAAEKARGYLHTYRTKHKLRLLYVDGQSAAKSQKGTLDVQDMVLLHHNPPSNDMPPGPPGSEIHKDEPDGNYDRGYGKPAPEEPRKRRGPLGEGERAQRLCRLAQGDWNGKIDGILRMEGGFEIILCDFASHLDVVRIVQTKGGGMGPGPGGHDEEDAFNYYEAVAARYDGIGGHRVSLNYEDFVTLYAYDGAVYFDDNGLPRVVNKTTVVEPVRKAITEMVTSTSVSMIYEGVDWQAVTDMVVARYAERIEYLASGDIQNLEAFKAEVDRALRPFIDYGKRDTTAKIARCASQFLPPWRIGSNELPTATLLNVTTVLCQTLSAAGDVEYFAHGVSMIRGLKSWLAWTEWKKCRGCDVHSLCFLPIWPVGNAEDFEQPRCRSDVSQAPGGYWGDFGRPPMKPHDPKR